ncbi:MAG: hypothetical protein J5949_03265 [Oscillospiraceae bacterium]|nr:hypothetical protein [Oscillospiraceae bacterium]
MSDVEEQNLLNYMTDIRNRKEELLQMVSEQTETIVTPVGLVRSKAFRDDYAPQKDTLPKDGQYVLLSLDISADGRSYSASAIGRYHDGWDIHAPLRIEKDDVIHVPSGGSVSITVNGWSRIV